MSGGSQGEGPREVAKARDVDLERQRAVVDAFLAAARVATFRACWRSSTRMSSSVQTRWPFWWPGRRRSAVPRR